MIVLCVALIWKIHVLLVRVVLVFVFLLDGRRILVVLLFLWEIRRGCFVTVFDRSSYSTKLHLKRIRLKDWGHLKVSVLMN